MRIIWFRSWDQPHNITVAVETQPGKFEANIPYLEGEEIRTMTHSISAEAFVSETARGQWVIEREIGNPRKQISTLTIDQLAANEALEMTPSGAYALTLPMLVRIVSQAREMP